MTDGLKGLFILLVTGLLAAPAAADWLVLNDGSRVETDGAFKVNGRLIVFTSASGDLASLRADEVDLTASERVTGEAQRAAAAGAVPAAEPLPRSPRTPVLVLTDADVGHVSPDQEVAEEGNEEAAAAVDGLRLNVVDWDQEESPDGEGVTVVGSLRNDGANVATSIQMQVQVLDSQAEIVGTTTATLSSNNLGSGEVLNFRAKFPELAGFDTARFDITGREFRPAPPVALPGELSEDEALRDREPEPAAEPY